MLKLKMLCLHPKVSYMKLRIDKLGLTTTQKDFIVNTMASTLVAMKKQEKFSESNN